MNANRALETRARAGAFAVIAIALVHAWFSRNQFLYEDDSVGFAFGMHEFAVNKDQPHAPGYPLWILLARLVNTAFDDAPTSLTFLALVFAAAAALVFAQLARRRFSDIRATILVALLVASPGFLFHAATATTYTVDLFAAVALGALAARAWEGSLSHGLSSVVLAAALAGVRQSGPMLMLPLVIVATWRACSKPLHVAYAALAGLATAGAWYIPTALHHGGVRAFQHIVRERTLTYLRYTSVFFGAPWKVHSEMALANVIWLALLMAPCAVLWTASLLRSTRRRLPAPRPFGDWRFAALWIAPNLLYVFLVHSPKPGYLCLTLPPLVFFVGGTAIERLPSRRGQVLAGSAAIALGLVIWRMPTSRSPDALAIDAGSAAYRLSARAIRDADSAMATLSALLKGSNPEEDLIATDDRRFGGLSWRKIAYYMPRHTVLFLYPHQPGFHEQLGFGERSFGSVPPSARRLWWVGPLSYAGPGVDQPPLVSRLVQRGSWLSVWVTDLADNPLALRIRRGQAFGDLRRLMSPRLGAGFSPVEGKGDQRFAWTSGPRSSILIPQTVAGTVTISMNVEVARAGQGFVLAARGSPIELVPDPRDASRFGASFRADAGWNALEIWFEAWNGANDRRPIAMKIRRLSIETGDGWYELIAERTVLPLIPLLHPGAIVDLGTNDRSGMLGSGWGNNVGDGMRWTTSEKAELRFRLSDIVALDVEVSGLTATDKDVVLEVNGHEVATWRTRPQLETFRAGISASQLARQNRLSFSVRGHDPSAAPKPQLQMGVQTFRITATGTRRP